jgi:hypothetical protein
VRSIHVALVSLVIGVLALGCRTTPPAPPPPPKPTREEVLQSLRQCLAESPKQRTPDGFLSPCAYRDVSSLNGISRAELIAALNQIPMCTNGKYLSELFEGPDCPRPREQDPLWVFFVQPMPVTGGGWPFLVCEAEGTASCVRVVWKKSL